MQQALVAFDTNKIKQYVFGTDKLKEIRGASAILDELNRTAMPTIVGGQKIYAEGGSGLFVLDKDQAAERIAAVQRRYREASGGIASMAAALVDLPDNFDPAQTPIQGYWQLLGQRLESAKQTPAESIGVVTHPLLRPCSSQGSTYASRAGVNINEVISQATYLKRQKRVAIVANTVEPEEIDALGEQSKPRGYIGLIYADGDNFGKAMRKCQTLNEIGALAKAVGESLRTVTQTALQDIQPAERVELLAGGDDLVLLLAAQHALPVANAIGRSFNNDPVMQHYELTLSVSVSWAHAHFPFATLLELAESGLKFAKRTGKERDQYGLVNFLAITSANHLEFDAYYKEVLCSKVGSPIYRTLRPYTNDDIDILIGMRASLKAISPTKLEQMRRAIFRPGIKQAMLEGLSLLTHLRERQRRDLHAAAAGLVPAPHGQPGPVNKSEKRPDILIEFPFVQRTLSTGGRDYHTPLADLIEVWDFLPGANAEA